MTHQSRDTPQAFDRIYFDASSIGRSIIESINASARQSIAEAFKPIEIRAPWLQEPLVNLADLRRQRYPANWVSKTLRSDLATAFPIIKDEGIPLVYVPRADIFTAILAANDRAERIQILIQRKADILDDARAAVTGAVDAAGVFGRRDRYVSNWDDAGQADWVHGIGATLVRGHGRLDGPRRVAVTGPDGDAAVCTARQAVVICTGTRAALPDLPGIADARPWTNRQATDSSSVPNRLAVVGAGGVGVEMATAWQGMGAAVTVLARGSRLLPRMEPFVGEAVAAGLTDAGAQVRVNVSVTKLRRPDADGPVTLDLSDGSELEVDEVLFATGRTPLTDDIGLETVGLPPGSWLDVDDTCRVRAVEDGWLYACGDSNHRALLTHQGKYQARIAGAAIGARAAGRPLDTAPWGAHVATADHHAVPQVFFTDPEAAAVGLSAEQAEQAGYRIQTVDVAIGSVVMGARLYADGYTGQARMVVDVDHGYLRGVTLVGPAVSELLHSATIAVAGRVPIDRLWHAVPCFPTISELWLRLLEAYRNSRSQAASTQSSAE